MDDTQEIGGFSKNITIIGRGERKKVHRERSDSYKCVRITIGYFDLTGKDLHKSIFEGNRDDLKMIDNPLPKVYQYMDHENS